MTKRKENYGNNTDIWIDAHASKKPCSNECDSRSLEKVSTMVETSSLSAKLSAETVGLRSNLRLLSNLFA